MTERDKKLALNIIIWFFEGVLVGFGAIVPGISGGTLCVAFGMYRPIIELLSDIKNSLKRYWFMLGCFMLGVFVGFVGLSGLADWLFEVNEVVVTCVFVGFILGTVPELFSDAGEQGRNKFSFISMGVCFVVMLGVLYLIESAVNIQIAPGIPAFLLCGVLWGLSFIVPGLSSSSLILFFGLYQPMLEGIGTLTMSVIIPLGIGMIVCLLLLAKLMGFAFKKYHSILSHGIIGIVVATTLMILPAPAKVDFWGIFVYILSILGGAALSFLFTVLCAKLKAKTENAENVEDVNAENAGDEKPNVQAANDENDGAANAQETDDWWFNNF